MNESPNLLVLGLGFVLGLKHATDPDHIVAVTTFLGEQRQLRRACGIGLFWGLGHTIALSIAGLVVIGLKIPISKWLADRLEFAVAVMLIILGVRLMTTVHTRWHEHHHDFTWQRFGLRPLLVKAFAPEPGELGSVDTVYDGSTGGPEKCGATAFVRNTSRQVDVPSDTT